MFMNKIQFGSQASNPSVYIGHCRVDVNFLIHVNSISLFIFVGMNLSVCFTISEVCDFELICYITRHLGNMLYI